LKASVEVHRVSRDSLLLSIERAEMTSPLVELTRDLVRLADERDTCLRALGGLGIELRAADADPLLRRGYGDVDLAAPKRAGRGGGGARAAGRAAARPRCA